MIKVLIPVLNEENNLRQTVRDVLDASADCGHIPMDIIIVDDGSTDSSAKIIKALESEYDCVRGVYNPVNVGVGESVKKILPMSKGEKFIIISGDNDMPQRLMVDVFSNHDKAEMIMTYFINRENRRVTRNVLSMMFQVIYMVTFKIFVQYVTGPVLYPTELLKKLKFKSKRFSIAPEMTVKCLRSGCTYYEISGYMQTGLEGSSAVSYKNLLEVIVTYFRLIKEVYFTNKKAFYKRPKRVYY